MSMIQSDLLLGQEGGAGYTISRSLRFNASDSAFLSRTPSSSSNRRTWTFATWIKGPFSATDFPRVLNVEGPSAGYRTTLRFTSGSLIEAYSYDGSNFQWQLTSSQVFRDPSAWFHLVLAVDTTQATSSNRVKLYINGVQVTAFSTANYPSLNFDTAVNHTSPHTIGGGQALSAYLADVFLIDGQALDPSSFVETSATTGQLIPKQYTGSFGTNGFWLKFSDNSAATATTLGKDYSGNSNNWTPNNLSVTAGAGNDSLTDTPTSYGTDTGAGGEVRGNYCTWNPVGSGSGAVLTNGNLDYSLSGAATVNRQCRGTVLIPTSGKWYWECTVTTVGESSIGVVDFQTGSSSFYYRYDVGGFQNIYVNDSQTAAVAGYTNNDVIGIGYDADNQQIRWYKNGSQVGTNYSLTNTGRLVPYALHASGSGSCAGSTNFGQRPFAYTAPSGFKALCDTNLPAPVVAKPSSAFDVKLYTGNGTYPNNVTGFEFSPSLVWIKDRSAARSNALFDQVRGTQRLLQSDLTDAEATLTTGLYTFNSNGFTLGTRAQLNTLNESFVAWAWDAGSSTVTNTQGSITSQVRANASAGFSIVTASVASSASGPTIGHGLGVTPGLIIAKNRTSAIPWYVWHSSFSANQKLLLNSTSAVATDTNTWGSITSSTLQMGATGTAVNVAWVSSGTENFVFYCFAPVAGYSSFGSYVGNGDSSGPFIWTGFRPRWVMWKPVTQSGTDWVIRDAARDSYNVVSNYLLANTAGAEGAIAEIDFLSNGFKFRNNLSGNNTNGVQVIYACFAESPFQYARAR